MAFLPKRARVGDRITAAAWNALHEEVRRLGNLRVSGMTMHNGPGGVALGVIPPPVGTIKAIASGTIPGRAGATEDGVGEAILYDRTPGTPDLIAQDDTVVVYNSYGPGVPDGTTIRVAPSPSGDYDLITSDCFDE
jgi:hypothetical protein